MKRCLISLLCLLSWSGLRADGYAANPDSGADEFHGSFGLRGTGVTYATGAPRDRFTSAGLFLDLDVRSWFGLTLGADGDRVRLPGQQDVPQKNAYGNIRIYLPLGERGGKLILRADAQQLTYDLRDSLQVSARMRGGHLGYLSDVDPLLARLYLDVAFNQTTYSGSHLVDQWTPTLGFGLNGNADWVSLSGSRIHLRPTASLGASVQEATAHSWRVGWTHYFLPGAALKPATFGLSCQGGRRIYAVDADAGLMVNHGEPQTSSWMASVSWKAGAGAIGFDGGRSRWEPAYHSPYSSTFLTTTFKFSW